ncbi:DoxX family protein [Nonomuraea sp. NPDC003804]|uniref:DoxX family protein n=1 Tax=Nonomuraea sp. NPDC003804 TaxID=3154547 RepID=UPI0033A12F83
MVKRIGSDIALLAARVMVGIIFIAHGLQKWHAGMDATTAAFAHLGVPSPQLAAYFATAAEIIGGAMLITGFGVRIAAFTLLVDMAGAGIFVESRGGIFTSTPGWELVVALAAVCLALLAFGGGRLGADGLLARWTATRDERIDSEDAPPRPPVPTGAVIISRASDDPSDARPFTEDRPTTRHSPYTPYSPYSAARSARAARADGPDPAHATPAGPVAAEAGATKTAVPETGATESGGAETGAMKSGGAETGAASEAAGSHAVPPQAGASQAPAETGEVEQLRSEVGRLQQELAATKRRPGSGKQP